MEVSYDSSMPSLGSHLREAREAASLTQKAVAAHFGISRVSVSQWESDTTRPDVEKLTEIAALYGMDAAALLAAYNSDDTPIIQPRERTRGQPVRSNFVPKEELRVNGVKLPVYSGAQGGKGKLIIGSDIVDRVEMPAVLKDVQGAYGLMIDGESMTPEFWPGDVAWVNPHLRPMRGKNHIFYHTPPFGDDAEAIIKRLNGWNDREWDLEQWNPAKKFKEFRQEWPICHRVVGKYDAV
ncbi:MAG: XRE family transcriptional regulator [Nitrobacter sp.]